ncbi:MAG TPA: histidine kinase, partial [Flavisolibacter sp.]|nr:histidine kinase [Flavisolibacter sp.]
IIVALVNSLKYYYELQEEKNKTIDLEKQLITSRINFLKQQLQPHFLFNTHHSIITLMKMDEKERAAEMMEKLSDLMRFALREDTSQEITLEKELSVLKLYLDIQRVRFEDKLRVEFDVPRHLLKSLVPSMILQPVVENSIKYAVERSSSSCTIYIRAEDEKENLILIIKDQVKEPLVTSIINKGIGLSNTEERLEKLYSTGKQFKMQPYNENGFSGVQVNIQIPLHHA